MAGPRFVILMLKGRPEFFFSQQVYACEPLKNLPNAEATDTTG